MTPAEHWQRFQRAAKMGPSGGPVPVLRGLPVLRQLLAIRENPYGVLSRAAKLGPISRVDVFHTPAYLVTEPDLIGPLLETQDVWERGVGLNVLLGQSILTTNGAAWKTARDFARPSFHPKMTDAGAEMFAQRAAPAFDRWRAFVASGEPVDIVDELVRLFAACGMQAFGIQLTDEELVRYPKAVLRLQAYALRKILGGAWAGPQVRRDRALLEEIVARAIDAPPPPDAPPSYLERLRQDRDVPREALRDHMMLVLMAAADNPPNATAFVLWLLAQNPDWEDAVRDELDRVCGGAPPTVAHAERLELLGRVVDEALRLFPLAWWMARYARVQTQLGPVVIEPGDAAFVGTWWLHRHPDHWPDPERFDPDRFLPAASAGRHPYVYLPFGRGPRRCIGSKIALQEIRLATALFLQRFRAVPTIESLDLYGLFALRSPVGIPCRIEERPR